MMPRATSFLWRLLAGGTLVALVGSVPMALLLGREAVVSWWAGAGVSLVNCFWGTLLIVWAIGRSHQAVLAAVCGGFFGRLVLASAAFYVLWGRPGMDGIVLALSIVGFYFVGMIVEIHFLHKHVLHVRPAGGGGGRERECATPR
jgi:hypothetical protein